MRSSINSPFLSQKQNRQLIAVSMGGKVPFLKTYFPQPLLNSTPPLLNFIALPLNFEVLLETFTHLIAQVSVNFFKTKLHKSNSQNLLLSLRTHGGATESVSDKWILVHIIYRWWLVTYNNTLFVVIRGGQSAVRSAKRNFRNYGSSVAL